MATPPVATARPERPPLYTAAAAVAPVSRERNVVLLRRPSVAPEGEARAQCSGV
jgi:hypothetical protein